MNIKKYICSLMKQLSESTESTNINEIKAKIDYARAYMHGDDALSKYRDRRIESEVRKKYSYGAEVRIALDYIKTPYIEECANAFDEHEKYIEQCKNIVDSDMANLMYIINTEINR